MSGVGGELSADVRGPAAYESDDAPSRLLIRSECHAWHYYHWIQYHATDDNPSGGSVEFRFYNIPSPGIREDVRFMVTPCSLEGELITSDACTADRHAHKNDVDAFRKQNMFLTGLYGKSNMALEASMAEVAAQYEAVAAAGGESTDADKAAAVQGLKLIYQARIGDVGAKIAVFFLAGKLAPLSAAFDSLNPGRTYSWA